jgi:hypothetical protein
MSNVLEIGCGRSISEGRRLNGRDHHSMSTMRTGKKE